MLTNDQLALWDRESFFHPSTHLASHARGETPSRIITGGSARPVSAPRYSVCPGKPKPAP